MIASVDTIIFLGFLVVNIVLGCDAEHGVGVGGESPL